MFCEGVGYIGNPVTWAEVTSALSSKYHHLTSKVENLRVAVLAAKAYTALALGDYIPAGSFASDLLARCRLVPIFMHLEKLKLIMSNIRESLPGGYKLLAHLYAAESLILQDKVGVLP